VPYTPPQTRHLTPKTEPSIDFDVDDLEATMKECMLQEKEDADNYLEEQLSRFYVDTGSYNVERIKHLKRSGFKWEPVVSHRWATEKALGQKEIFIHQNLAAVPLDGRGRGRFEEGCQKRIIGGRGWREDCSDSGE